MRPGATFGPGPAVKWVTYIEIGVDTRQEQIKEDTHTPTLILAGWANYSKAPTPPSS